ncbi:hypothetical protein KR032_005916 [Drosophila birchii]|nr:hypothetical protein KR032_005916 [Drosophila birchii]
MTKLIKLVSSQNKIFQVPQAIMKCSGIISIFCEDYDNGIEEEALSLSNINSFILEKVLTWAKYHHEAKGIADWDNDFINMDICTLIELVAAGDYLDIPDLWSLGCMAVAAKQAKNYNNNNNNNNLEVQTSRQI